MDEQTVKIWLIITWYTAAAFALACSKIIENPQFQVLQREQTTPNSASTSGTGRAIDLTW
jgi:hypothetical protein